MWQRLRNNQFLLAGSLLSLLIIAITLLVLNTLPGKDTSRSTAKPLKPAKVELKPLASGFSQPTAIVATPTPSDSRLFIVEQAGRIRILDTVSKQIPAAPFLDITAKVKAGGEMGLLGLAFHPRYADNGYFYINYIDKAQNTVIARYQTGANGLADSSSQKVLLQIRQPYQNHNGGDLQFGPDGYLYIALGDGGAGGDPQNRAQNLTELLGKILRLDVDSGDPYVIPGDNPFLDRPGARAEIWAYGLRNPWRISFDRKTGDLWIGDVGQSKTEEINLQIAVFKSGANYGWRCYEGSAEFNLEGCRERSEFIFPVIEYDRGEGRCSVTGGYVYRGQTFPALDGKYFYADFCNGQLFYAEPKGDRWQPRLTAETDYQISTFGQGSGGELYLADYLDGAIYQIVDTAN